MMRDSLAFRLTIWIGVAFLYPGPNYDALSDKTIPENLALQAAHLEGVRAHIADGTQILAAPVMTPGSKVNALGVFPASLSVEQVTEIMQSDPAIAAGPNGVTPLVSSQGYCCKACSTL